MKRSEIEVGPNGARVIVDAAVSSGTVIITGASYLTPDQARAVGAALIEKANACTPEAKMAAELENALVREGVQRGAARRAIAHAVPV